MYIFRTFLAAFLINWCRAEYNNSSVNASVNQLPQGKIEINSTPKLQTEYNDLEFGNSSRVREHHPVRKTGTSNRTKHENFISSRNQDRTKNRLRKHYARQNANGTKHRPRVHKFQRPALLDNLHMTLSMLDEIMKKPLFRRIAQDMPSKLNLRDGPILSTEESLYRGNATRYNTSVQKWPKLNTRNTSRREYAVSRRPKELGKAMARKSNDDDDSRTNLRRSPDDNPADHTSPKDEETTKSKGTKKKSALGDSLSPYSIKLHLKEIAAQFPEANISVEVIGRTVSYNDIILLKVTEAKGEKNRYFRAEDKFLDEGPEKKIVFIVHGLSVMGIHMIPCMLQKDPLKKLLSYYFAHLDKFDIFLIPMANPDGVSVNPGEPWNKNMSPQKSCSGVCLDRNFDVAWNVSRSTSSCSQQYPGSSPFSEEETRAVRDVIHRFSHKIVAYLHLHSATYTADIFKGDAVLYPKGYTEVQTDDDKYIDLRGEIDEAMKNASFQILTVVVDTLYNWYGKVSGTSVDYASSVYGIPYAMELVMQIYMDDPSVKEPEETETAVALHEVWRRVIDVIFHNVYKFVRAQNE